MSIPWIDLSVALDNNLVTWPGDPAFHLEHALDYAKGDQLMVSRIDCGVHTGTHMDAPLHFIPGGQTIDQIPLDATVGPARVVEIRDPESITPAELVPARIQPGERLLFKTKNSAAGWAHRPFNENFVHISLEAAELLASIKPRCVGVDYLSVGGFHKNGPETHRALLGAGIWLIEGLNLAPLSPGPWELICLPLKLAGAEGALSRAIARPLNGARA